MKVEAKTEPIKSLSFFAYGTTLRFNLNGDVYIKSDHLDMENRRVMCFRLTDGHAAWFSMESDAYSVPLKAVPCEEGKP